MKLKPYKILWWTIPIVILCFTFLTRDTIDIQMHDTYFVIPPHQLSILFTLILGGIGGLYWVLKDRHLNALLSSIHSIGTAVSLIVITLMLTVRNKYFEKLTAEDLNSIAQFEAINHINTTHSIVILVFLILQVLFLVNIGLGLIKGNKADL